MWSFLYEGNCHIKMIGVFILVCIVIVALMRYDPELEKYITTDENGDKPTSNRE